MVEPGVAKQADLPPEARRSTRSPGRLFLDVRLLRPRVTWKTPESLIRTFRTSLLDMRRSCIRAVFAPHIGMSPSTEESSAEAAEKDEAGVEDGAEAGEGAGAGTSATGAGAGTTVAVSRPCALGEAWGSTQRAYIAAEGWPEGAAVVRTCRLEDGSINPGSLPVLHWHCMGTPPVWHW